MKFRQNLFRCIADVASKLVTAAMLVLIFDTSRVSAATEAALPIPMAWEQSFGDEQYSYQSKAVLIAPTGILTLVGTYAPLSKQHIPPEGIWIWKVDGSGRKISDVRLDRNLLGSKLIGVDACELVEKDVVAMVVRSSSGSGSLIHVDASGKVLRTMDLGSRQIAKLFRMSDNSLVLAGQKHGDALLMKLDKSGAVIWEKVTDKGKDDSLIDGNIVADRLVLVELSGKQEQFSITDSMVGLVKPAKDGKMGAPVFSTKGRAGSVASDLKRTVLVYDGGMKSEQDIRFVVLDGKFRVIREASITKAKLALERFKVGRAGNSGFIVVGTIGGKMILTFIDTGGQVKWQHTRLNNDAFFLNPEVAGGEVPYVVSNTMVLTKDKLPRTLVNILKVESSQAEH